MNKPVEQVAVERFRVLVMGAVDNELTTEEQREFETLLERYPVFREEWQAYKRLKEVTQSMTFKTPSDEVWDNYWMNVYNRIERGIAWIIISIGAVILTTYGLFQAVESIIADPQIEGILKVGIILTIGGFTLLIVSTLRERLRVRKADPYKEVKR